MEQIFVYFEKTYQVESDTVLTLISSFTVFFVGLFFQKLISVFKGLISRKKTRQIFAVAIGSFEKQTLLQAREYERASLTFNLEQTMPFEFKRVAISSVNLFAAIGYQNAFEAYFYGIENQFRFNSKKRIKAFNKIWAIVNNVEYWKDQSMVLFKDFISQYNTINDKRNLALENHRRLSDRIILEYSNQMVSKELSAFLKRFDSISRNWQSSTNRTKPYVIHRKLILPLRILNRKYNNLTIASDLNDNLIAATIEYINLSRLLKTQKIQIRILHSSFKNNSKICKMALSILEKPLPIK